MWCVHTYRCILSHPILITLLSLLRVSPPAQHLIEGGMISADFRRLMQPDCHSLWSLSFSLSPSLRHTHAHKHNRMNESDMITEGNKLQMRALSSSQSDSRLSGLLAQENLKLTHTYYVVWFAVSSLDLFLVNIYLWEISQIKKKNLRSLAFISHVFNKWQ